MGTLCASDYRLPIGTLNFFGGTGTNRFNVERTEAERALCIREKLPMTIEAPSADRSCSPFHMMASGLAYERPHHRLADHPNPPVTRTRISSSFVSAGVRAG